MHSEPKAPEKDICHDSARSESVGVVGIILAITVTAPTGFEYLGQEMFLRSTRMTEQKSKKMVAVGFEPTPFRTRA